MTEEKAKALIKNHTRPVRCGNCSQVVGYSSNPNNMYSAQIIACLLCITNAKTKVFNAQQLRKQYKIPGLDDDSPWEV